MSSSLQVMADLVQRVPRLLTYSPTSHVVILGTNGDKLAMTSAYEPRDAALSAEGADRVTQAAQRHQVTGLIVLTFGLDQLTDARAVRDIRQQAQARQLIVRETARVAHGRMWVGRERGAGHPVPDGPQADAATVTREQLAASWTPTGTLTPDLDVQPREGARVWARLLAGDTLTEAEQRQALGAVASILGRDSVLAAFGMFESPAEWPEELAETAATVRAVLQGVRLSGPLEHLRTLVTACDPQHAAQVCAVAAVLAWTGGNGAIAYICAERANQAQPGHRLAELVARATQVGIAPPWTP